MSAQPQAARRSGPLVVVLGPSGAGKDTLITHAAAALGSRSHILFVRRSVTRPAQTGAEDHDSLSEEGFDAAMEDGRFCFSWAANGLRYGLPHAMTLHLAEGGVAVVNGSRAAFPALRAVFPGAIAVEVTARRDILKARLLSRGRESEADIEARLDRADRFAMEGSAALVIDNSGEVGISVQKLARFLDHLVA